MEGDMNSSFSLAQQQNALLSNLAQVQREWKEERAKLVAEHRQEVSDLSKRLQAVSTEKEHLASRAAELEQRVKDAERRAEDAEQEASKLQHELDTVRTDKEQLLRILHSTSQREKDGHMARLRPSVAQALGWEAGDESELYGTGSSSFHQGMHPASAYVGWGGRWEDRSSVGRASLRTDVLPVARRGRLDHPREREDWAGRGIAPRRRRHVSDSASDSHASDDRADVASEASTASAFVSDLESSNDGAESGGDAADGLAVGADAAGWRKSDGAKWEIFRAALAAVNEAVRIAEPWAARRRARSLHAPREGSGDGGEEEEGEGKSHGAGSDGDDSAEEGKQEQEQEQGGTVQGSKAAGEGSGGTAGVQGASPARCEGRGEEEEEEEEEGFVDASAATPERALARGGIPFAADAAWREAIARLHALWAAWAAETRAASAVVSRLDAERTAHKHRAQRQRAAWRADRGRLRLCEAAEASARRRAAQAEKEVRRVEARSRRWRQAVEAKLSELAKGRSRARMSNGSGGGEGGSRADWRSVESSPAVGRGSDAGPPTTGSGTRRRSRWQMGEIAAGSGQMAGEEAGTRSGRMKLPSIGR